MDFFKFIYCSCSNCSKERGEALALLVSKLDEVQGSAPLVKRVNLKQLDTYLRLELQDMGIKTPFRYGVFDTQKN